MYLGYNSWRMLIHAPWGNSLLCVLRKSVYCCSFGNGIVNEDNLAAASVVGRCEKHTLGIDVTNSCGLEVGKNYDLSANELFGLVVFLDRGHDRSLGKTVGECEL